MKPHEELSDSARLAFISELIRNSPHGKIGFNDDPDTDEGASGLMGFYIIVDGCRGELRVVGDTLAAVIDKAKSTLDSEHKRATTLAGVVLAGVVISEPPVYVVAHTGVQYDLFLRRYGIRHEHAIRVTNDLKLFGVDTAKHTVLLLPNWHSIHLQSVAVTSWMHRGGKIYELSEDEARPR